MDENCEICFKIVCKGCGWEANADETVMVQKGQIRACPICNWSPEKINLASE